jgi:hypothetical protein
MSEDADSGQNDTGTEEGSQTQEESTLLSDGKSPEVQVDASEDKTGGESNAAQGDSQGDSQGETPDEYKFEMPEGVNLDEGLAKAAQPVFKDLGLNQGQADKLTELLVESRARDMNSMNQAYSTQRDNWIKELKEDPNFGGEAFEKNASIAAMVPKRLGTPELVEMLRTTGIGNNPELVRVFHRVSLELGLREDQPGSGEPASAGSEVEDRLYGGTTPNKSALG